MKKLLYITPFIFMFIILAVLFVFMCLPQSQDATETVFTVDLYFLRTRVLYCLALGCIFMMAFYHFTLYAFRKKESVYLCFSLICILCFVRFVFETNGLNNYFNFISNEVFRRRFFAVVWVIHAYLITYFSLVLLESSLLKKWFVRKHIYLFIAIFPFLVLPFRSSIFAAAASILFLVPAIFNIVSVWRSPKRKENPFMLMYLISLVLFLIIGSTSKIFAHDFFMPGIVTNMFLMMTQMILLSRNYARAFLFVEETNENLERIVNNRTKDLRNTNSAMKELIGNISHDLKTPLAVMSVNLEELQSLSETQDEEYQRHVRIAYDKNLDLQRLIQNLIEISRIETGQSLISPAWVSLLDVLELAQDKYDDFLRNKDIFFEIYCTEDVEIYIDPQRIWSIFDNIVYNAARHTGHGGTVTVNASSSGQTAAVTITDTGCGIDAEHLPHIFERFYKASASRGGSGGDSGLGLYIVKSVMEALGGSVAAESEAGKGTSIILSFVKKAD